MGHSMRIQYFRYCYEAYSYQIVGNLYKSLQKNSPQEFQIEAFTTMYAENIRFLLFLPHRLIAGFEDYGTRLKLLRLDIQSVHLRYAKVIGRLQDFG